MHGKLYLVPTDLGGTSINDVIPSKAIDVATRLKHFIVEDIRTARRYLSRIKTQHPIDDIQFQLLNEHTQATEFAALLAPVIAGNDVGLLSEAGLPCLADPGANVVRIAHEKGIKVVPLVGPSSIFLALIASGMNGQNFAFVGYLPAKPHEREQRIRVLENRSIKERQSQLFIEAPYRNNQLLSSLLNVCHPNTLLCIACNLTCDDEYVASKTIEQWKKQLPDIQKKPCIFILQG